MVRFETCEPCHGLGIDWELATAETPGGPLAACKDCGGSGVKRIYPPRRTRFLDTRWSLTFKGEYALTFGEAALEVCESVISHILEVR